MCNCKVGKQSSFETQFGCFLGFDIMQFFQRQFTKQMCIELPQWCVVSGNVVITISVVSADSLFTSCEKSNLRLEWCCESVNPASALNFNPANIYLMCCVMSK